MYEPSTPNYGGYKTAQEYIPAFTSSFDELALCKLIYTLSL